MIGDVEHLRPELNVENFRDSPDRDVLQDRKVKVEESRPVDAIAAAVTRKVRAIYLAGRSCRSRWKISARERKGGRCRSGHSRERGAAIVDPDRRPCVGCRGSGVNGIAAG